MMKVNSGLYIDAYGNTCSLDNPGVPVIWAACPADEYVSSTGITSSIIDTDFGLLDGGMMMSMDSSFDSMSCSSFDF
ncbi:hypothetical protein [Cobetia marina]|uniref:hypothetical protein n=1 Tax=Cobetia marina TaxID=28258 RepID=UPI003A8D1442